MSFDPVLNHCTKIANEVDSLPSQSEHETQTRIINLIQDRKGVVTRINSGSMLAKSQTDRVYRVQLADKGTSDIIALYKGVYLAIEVKFGKNKATKEQIEFLELVANAGGVGLLVYDVQFIASVLVTIDDDPITPLPLSEALLWTVKEPNRLFVGGIK
jgi:hypothetical protein